MNSKDLEQVAKTIIQNNIYLTLATSDGVPWIAPLFYCPDNQGNLYYISRIDARHSQHIAKNPHVAFSVFDSHQKEGQGNGVQGSGYVKKVSFRKIPEALRWYHTDFFTYDPRTFRNVLNYRLFKIIPDHLYVLNPDVPYDERVLVL